MKPSKPLTQLIVYAFLLTFAQSQVEIFSLQILYDCLLGRILLVLVPRLHLPSAELLYLGMLGCASQPRGEPALRHEEWHWPFAFHV